MPTDATRGSAVQTGPFTLEQARRSGLSPRETYVRLLLVLAGLPEPECNVDLGSRQAFVGRADLVYLAYSLIVEYDGRDHVDVKARWDRDLDRLDEFEDARWGYVRVTKHRLKRPRDVVRRVHAKLAARGYDGPAPRFGPEWVAVFETRSAAWRAAETVSPGLGSSARDDGARGE